MLSGSETNCTSAFHLPTPEHSLAVLGGRAGTRGGGPLCPRQASVTVGQAYTAEASPGLPHVTIRGLCKAELSLSLVLLQAPSECFSLYAYRLPRSSKCSPSMTVFLMSSTKGNCTSRCMIVLYLPPLSRDSLSSRLALNLIDSPGWSHTCDPLL